MQLGRLRTIRSKIGLCIVITTIVAMGLGSSLFILFATSWFQGRTQNELDALTDLVSSSCEAALDFDDQAAAEIVINSLRAHRDIVAGCLYEEDQSIVAAYRRDADTEIPPQPLAAGFEA